MNNLSRSSRKSNRILFIDIARTYAVFLALFAHFVSNYGPPGKGIILGNYMFFTSIATPLFIIIFGFMMEIVYSPKIEQFQHIKRKMLIRSLQCYCAYLFTAFAAAYGGFINYSDIWRVALFAERSRHGNILLLYTVLLLIMPYILLGKNKFGNWFLVITFILISLLSNLISNMERINFGIYDVLITNLIGIGESRGGPSVLFSLLFVIVGIAIGNIFTKNKENNINIFLHLITFVIALLILTYLFNIFFTKTISIKNMLEGLGYGSFRANGSLNFLFIGSILSVSSFIILFIACNGSIFVKNIFVPITPVGRSSLLSFTAGNIILNSAGAIEFELNYFLSLLIFFSIIYLISRFHYDLPFYTSLRNLFYFTSKN